MVLANENRTEVDVKRGHTYYQWIFSLLAGCTNLAYGLEYGWISPTAKQLQAEDSPSGYPLSDMEIAWVTSSMSIAATCVVIVHSYICDRHGRKISIIFLAFMQAVAWLIRIFNSSFVCLILARVCSGIAVGGCYTVVLMYIKEISQDDIRGKLCTCTIILQCIGIFTMYFIGAYLDYYTVTYIIIGIPIMAMLGMMFGPESPEFLIKQMKIDKALETVAFMRGLDKDDHRVINVVEAMIIQTEKFQSLPDVTILSIFRNKVWRRGFILIMIAFTFYEMNGVWVITTFAAVMLTSTGIEFSISPEILSLSFPVVMLIGSLAITSCIEKYGRKPILIGAYFVSCLCMFGMVIVIILQTKVRVPEFVPVVLMILAIAAFSGGVYPVTFLMLIEMFNFQIRAKLVGLVMTYGLAVTAILLQVYLPIANSLGAYVPFIFFGFINLIGILFTIFYLTETKGKTEEEILKDLMKKKKIRKSVSTKKDNLRVESAKPIAQKLAIDGQIYALSLDISPIWNQKNLYSSTTRL